jgi:hypothetical protein
MQQQIQAMKRIVMPSVDVPAADRDACSETAHPTGRQSGTGTIPTK